VDAVESVLAAFDTANLVALGERHWAREDSQFRLALVRSPAFPRKANDIVVEFANPLYQPLLDRFIAGEPVPAAELQRIWRDTTQPGAFDSPVYEEFLRAIRALNAELPPRARVRVLAADSPIDWRTISTPAGLDGPMRQRDRSAAAVIQHEVLDRNRRALVIFGAAHLYRKRAGTIVDLLKEDSRTRWFIVAPTGGPGLPSILAANAATPEEPKFLKSAGTPLSHLPAGDVLELGSRRIQFVDGKPLFRDGKPVFIAVFEAGVRVGDLADACLCFGTAQPEFVLPPEPYDGTEYGIELQRRRSILRLYAFAQ
jgi:hypothetical protein